MSWQNQPEPNPSSGMSRLVSRQQSLSDWQQNNQAVIVKLNQLLSTVTRQGANLAPVSVTQRELRQLA
nr:hypothetical protein [uncultured Undibacterium sp.]